ncbi:hypothetical protein B7486_19915 [cyanobacterium TDX16]|nr:hypothetical protein B7486_19915 [cyanobacterium TDX16]
MKKLPIAALALFAALTLNTGCSKVVGRAVNEMKGSSSKSEPVPGMSGGSFASYQGVTIAPPRTELGGLVSTEFKTQLSAQLRKYLVTEKDAPFKGSSPMLTIEPAIMWYHRGGVGGLMPEKFVVTLFYLKADGADIGRVQIVTKSKAAGSGDDDLAESAAKELVDYFQDHGKKK